MGVYLEYSSYNEIKFNNFKDNNRDGSFHKQADNDWDSNYWDSLNFFIKLILGRVGIIFWFIPWFNIDWNPASEPYDIEV